ncbi:hypothetical protein JCM3775_007266, partial [Rhodotorula graminis]
MSYSSGAPSRVRLDRPSPALLRVALLGALVLGVLVQTAQAAASALPLSKTKTMFLFGDSYTQNGFDLEFGYNLSSQFSVTSAGGPTWPDYLVKDAAAPASLRNAYYDFARGGATISAERQLIGYPNVSLAAEVDLFQQYFVDSKAGADVPGTQPDWDAASTLFTIWFGINDIEITWRRGEEFPPMLESIFGEFQDGVDRLYDLGARHFLLPLLPPYHRAPLFGHIFPSAQDTIERDFSMWNSRLRQFAADLMATKTDASFVVWDAWTAFGIILDRPSEFAFLNADDYCEAYSKYVWAINPPKSITDIKNCAVPMSQYTWIDKSHPTTAVHRVLARSIGIALGNPASTFSPTGLFRRSVQHLPTHRRPPPLPFAGQLPHDRFARLMRRAAAPAPQDAKKADSGFWSSLRDTAIGSVTSDIGLAPAGSVWLWTLFGVFTVSLLVLLGLAHSRSQQHCAFHYVAIVVLAITAVHYAVQASNLGYASVPVEWVRSGSRGQSQVRAGAPSPPTRSIFYAQWVGYVLTTPLLVLMLLLATGFTLSRIFLVLFFTVLWTVCLLIGALIPTRYKWALYAFAVAALF